MAEADPIPSVFELDWFGDFTLYQHPPCMFILWYLALGGKKVYELINELLNGKGEGGEDGKAAEGDGKAAEGDGKAAEGDDKDKGEGSKEGEGGAENAEGGEGGTGEEPAAEEAAADEPPPPEEEAAA